MKFYNRWKIWFKPIISYLRTFPFSSSIIRWLKNSPQQTINEITVEDIVLPSKKSYIEWVFDLTQNKTFRFQNSSDIMQPNLEALAKIADCRNTTSSGKQSEKFEHARFFVQCTECYDATKREMFLF